MPEEKENNLLNPEKPLTLKMAEDFIKKYTDYYTVKREITPQGSLLQPSQKLSPVQMTSTSRD